jgi:murein DD-endopeptidase MepM/ murein hydrolase activator NlpD
MVCLFIVACTNNEKAVEQTEEKHPYINIGGKIKPGSSLYSDLLEKNITQQDAYKITSSLNSEFDLRYAQPNDSFFIVIDTLGQVQKLEYYPNKIDRYFVIRDTAGEFNTLYTKIDLTKETQVRSGRVETSLYQALVDQKLPPKLIMQFSDIFQWDIDFFIDPRTGDSCKLVYEIFTHKGEILEYGNILAASYMGKRYNRTAYYFENGDNVFGYFDRDGSSFQKAFLKSPLNYSYISSYFSYARYHPILKIVCPHNGVDYAAPYGTPVVASADGTVIFKGWNNGYGNCIKIRHKNGRYVTLYGHLSNYARGINVGTKVKQKQLIGYVGSTGYSTGPHLHYTIYDNGRAIDPLKLENVAGPPVPEHLIDEFRQVVFEMDNLLNYNEIVEHHIAGG